MNTIDIYEDKFVSMQFITELTGLSDKWFYKMAQEGQFPKPIKFGRSSRWIEREVKEWLEERIKNSRGNGISASNGCES
ncbi:AlpA family phage regulatory protein [Enterobacter hormaechei]|uniref:helix-turn-helix transcriptional regulator n=1 Tax=Enterobacter hormaechei TaxID=158836 RepID=UPI001239AF24|nr:AlpA family phage regulatory protein [Enterobacter hormaechei]MCM7441824.1 AlpA family phage regulatory protein [Enterobacter hormaechei]MDG0827688.1 AlpA family phage regulatory protein [Enterobacter hormaechei]MDG0848576.1 AlpA family phage regulatory protein [Enterobacter hormaechei]